MANAELGDRRFLQPQQPVRTERIGASFLDGLVNSIFDVAAIVITQFPGQKRVAVFRGEADRTGKVTSLK